MSVLNLHFLFHGAWRTPCLFSVHDNKIPSQLPSQSQTQTPSVHSEHSSPVSHFPALLPMQHSVAVGSCKAQFHPKTPWFCAFRAKQNRLDKMDYGTRNYFGTAQGQLHFKYQQVLKVSHFWQEHSANETQTSGSRVFLQCFNGPNSRTRPSVCPWVCSLC